MRKGQISLDFLVTIILLIVLIQVLVRFNDNFSLNQEKTLIRLQAKHIVSELDKMIKYGYSLNTNERSSLIFQIPKISLSAGPTPGESAEIGCSITLNGPPQDTILLTVDQSHYPRFTEDETITEQVQNTFPKPFTDTVLCGDTIVFKETPECWNAVLEGSEQCECEDDDSDMECDDFDPFNLNLGGFECEDLYNGVSGGFLNCYPKGHPNECTFDTTSCDSTACTDIPFTSIAPACLPACNPSPNPGPNTVEAAEGLQQCLPGGLCCVEEGVCGNTVIEDFVGEHCEIVDGEPSFLAGQENCGPAGRSVFPPEPYDGGDLGCYDIGTPNECTFDFDSCTLCGDLMVEGAEQCDGSVPLGTTCASITSGAKQFGTPACNAEAPGVSDPNECQFNADGCHNCGNGDIDIGEQCELGETGSCTDLNPILGTSYVGGQYSCNLGAVGNWCSYNTTGCISLVELSPSQNGFISCSTTGQSVISNPLAAVGLYSNKLLVYDQADGTYCARYPDQGMVLNFATNSLPVGADIIDANLIFTGVPGASPNACPDIYGVVAPLGLRFYQRATATCSNWTSDGTCTAFYNNGLCATTNTGVVHIPPSEDMSTWCNNSVKTFALTGSGITVSAASPTIIEIIGKDVSLATGLNQTSECQQSTLETGQTCSAAIGQCDPVNGMFSFRSPLLRIKYTLG